MLFVAMIINFHQISVNFFSKFFSNKNQLSSKIFFLFRLVAENVLKAMCQDESKRNFLKKKHILVAATLQ